MASALPDDGHKDSYFESNFTADPKEPIGSGGYGKVFRVVEKKNPSCIYALKVGIKERSAEREASNLQNIPAHQNIVRYYNNWTETHKVGFSSEKRFYILMEYCGSGDLRKWLNTPEEKSLEVADDIFVQLLTGLAHIHQLRPHPIIHRDIKPENIFLTNAENKLIVKLGDFGLAREMDTSNMTSRVGTYIYTAPELLETGRRKYDEKVDVFSLGKIYYELHADFSMKGDFLIWFQRLKKDLNNSVFCPKFARNMPKRVDLVKRLVAFEPYERPNAWDVLHNYTFIYKTLKFPLRHNLSDVDLNYSSRQDLETEIIVNLKNVFKPKLSFVLRKLLFEDHRDARMFNFPLVVLYGISGMGKTVLARNVCQLMGDYTKNCVWINARTEEMFTNSFAELLGTPKIKTIVQATLKDSYSSQFKNNRCLIVFDGVENYDMLMGYLPIYLGTQTSILITSKFICPTIMPGGILVKNFIPTEFSKFVRIFFKASEVEIESLSKYTGRIPYFSNAVCLDFVNWSKKQTGNVDIKKYLKDEKANLWNTGIYEMFEKQINTIKDSDENAYTLLCVLAYCKRKVEESHLIDVIVSYKKLGLNKQTDLFLRRECAESIEILIQNGFIEKNGHCLRIYTVIQKAMSLLLQLQEKEIDHIKKIINLDLSFPKGYLCLNFSLLANLGKKYGDCILNKMEGMSHFIPLIKTYYKIENLVAFGKRSKTKNKHSKFVLFGEPKLGLTSLISEENSKFMESIVDNFQLLVEELNMYNGTDRRQKLVEFAKYAVFTRRDWLEIFFDYFPDLLEEADLNWVQIAVEISNLSALQYFVEKGHGVDNENDFTRSPLAIALSLKNSDIMEMLLKVGANPNIRDKHGQPLLNLAVKIKNILMVKLLVSYKADFKNKDQYGKTALEIAIQNAIYEPNGFDRISFDRSLKAKNLRIVEILLKAGADPNVQNSLGQLPFHLAVEKNNDGLVELLVSNKAKINIKDDYGRTAMDIAMENHNRKIIDKLVKYSNLKFNLANLPNFNIIAKLVKAGYPDIQDSIGQTPLHLAAKYRYIGLINKLVLNVADVNVKDHYGKTALEIALQNAIDEQSDFNFFLDRSLKSKNLNIVDMLLKIGANPNIQNSEEKLPLHFAVEKNRAGLVELLVSNKADFNIKDKYGRTALEIALLNTVNKQNTNDCNSTPFKFQKKIKNLKIVEILLKAGADPNIQISQGQLPLHLALENKHAELVELLVSNKADFNIRDKDGRTALHIAVTTFNNLNNFGIVELILKAGGNPNIQDFCGQTPLHLAVEENSL